MKISLPIDSVYNYIIIVNYNKLKNKSCLPRPGIKPGTSSYGTRKKLCFTRLRLVLAAPYREYFLLNASPRVYRILAGKIAAVHIVHTISSHN